jgi:dCMP deaminase
MFDRATPPGASRQSWDEYYLSIADAVALRGNCLRRKVGAIIVVERRIVSTGYNGTPYGAINCLDGGCPRCAGTSASYTGYDECLCVHAEMNSVLLAARHGTAVNFGTLYCGLRPCLGCLKSLIQAGVTCAIYRDDFRQPDDDLERAYQALAKSTGFILKQLAAQESAQ